MKKVAVFMAIALIAFAGFTSTAGATLSFYLNIQNGALVTPGPYARVDVTTNGANFALIRFTSLTNSGIINLFGDGGSVAVNVNALAWTVLGASIHGTNSGVGFTPGGWGDAGGGNEDGFGFFNQRIDSFDGYTHSSDMMEFQVQNLSGFWLTDNDVLGNGPFRAAAHIFQTYAPANAFNGAITTGFAADDGRNIVPEPASMLLLGLGLAWFGAARRRRKS